MRPTDYFPYSSSSLSRVIEATVFYFIARSAMRKYN